MHDACNHVLLEQLCYNIIEKEKSKYASRRLHIIVISRFQSRYLEISISHKGAILWNTITAKYSDITYATQMSIDSRLCEIWEFRDFNFRVTITPQELVL